MGFNPRLAPYSTTIHAFTDDPTADKQYAWFRFPEPGMIVGGYAANDANVTGTTHMVNMYLEGYGTDGTTTKGTVASIAGGASWTAGAPRAWLVTTLGSTAHFAQGEIVSLKYDEVTTALFNDATFQLDYVLGYIR